MSDITAAPQPKDEEPKSIAPKGEVQIVTEKAPRREYTATERILILIALVIGVMFDRLTARLFLDRFLIIYGAFWLIYIAAFYVLNRDELRDKRMLWLIAAFAALLCVWCMLKNTLFASDEFAALTIFVIPCVLMGHAQLYAEDIAPKQVIKLVLAWFTGFFVRPFSAIGRFFGAMSSFVGAQRRSVAKNVLIAVFVSILLLALILPLLMRADWVFEYYIGKLYDSFNIGSFIGHALLTFVAAALFYSFLWNSRYKRRWLKINDGLADSAEPATLVSCIVLSVVIAVYALFCAVQFTYLFARAGLPAEMTYSQYAREGFAQIVTICVINLLLYGFFVSGKKKCKPRSALLAALLAVTVIILASGAMRLSLYIDAYGMTWLRLLSAWFMVYIAAAIVICALRMVKTHLPAVMACAIVLLIWFTMLGFANPDKLISGYNSSYGYDGDRIEYNID